MSISFRFNNDGQQSVLDGIKIVIKSTALSGGREIQIDEVFRDKAYAITDNGPVSQEITITFKLTNKLEPAADLHSLTELMEDKLNEGENPLLLEHPLLGNIYVVNGTYTVNYSRSESVFNVNLVRVPPPETFISYDRVDEVLSKITDSIDFVKDHLDRIANEANSLVLVADDILKIQAQFLEPFNSLKNIVATPFVIARRAVQFGENLKNLGPSIADTFIDGLGFEGVGSDSDVVVPIGGITRYFEAMTDIPINDRVSATLVYMVMIVMVQEHIKAEYKTLEDITAASELLEKTEGFMRAYLPIELLEEYSSLRLSFDKMIHSKAFGLENQVMLPAHTRKPVVVSIYEKTGSVDDFYNLEKYNTIHHYFFGDENEELRFHTE